MSRNTSADLAKQEEARKDTYTGMIQQSMSQIPNDYTDQQKASIRQSELGGIDIGFGNLKDEAMRRASATGSYAGMPETLDEFGKESIRQKSDAAAALETQFANVPVQRALQQASIYQPAIGGMLYSRNVPNQQPSTLDSILGAAGSVVGGIIGA